jgi:outer membrane receptor protein involved in Fe transport
MKNKLLFFLIGVLIAGAFFSSAALAQSSGKISGYVRDAKTKEPLPGVNVVIKDTKLGASTDLKGFYFILNVSPGKYEVKASMVGYQSVIQQEVIVNVDKTTRLDFYITDAAISVGKEIVVTAERPDVLPEKTSSSEIIRTEDILLAPGINDINDVISLSADVIDGHFRGGREGEELYNLSGMGIVNPLNRSLSFTPILSAIEEVEVITSGFSAQYGNAQSGVINISMKEGNREKWKSRVELQTRLPEYKHWGGSVFDVSKNPYLQLLDTWQEWAGQDPVTDRIFYDFISYGFANVYKDTAQAAQIAYALWKQGKKDLNRQYDDLWDKNIELSVDGPLSSNASLFLAGRFDNQWQVIPASVPDKSQQLIGNLSFDLGKGMSLKVNGAYSFKTGNSYSGLGSTSYQSFRYWLWDRVYGISNYENQSVQFGLRFAQAVNKKSYYEIKLSALETRYKSGARVLDQNRFRDDFSDRGTWRYFNTPDIFRMGYTGDEFNDEKTKTFSFDGSFTSQVTNSHLLLAGMQANFYDINVNNWTSLSSSVQAQDEIYSAKPYEFAAYVQDKMEFEGMIANVGLRLDVYNNNVDYYSDKFSPVRNPNYDPSKPASGTNKYYSAELAAKKKSPTFANLQPRVGISFPITVNTVFHLNYGSFLQRPQYDQTIYKRVNRLDGSPIRLGNPELKPQDTKSYDVGISQGLGDGFTLDISGYYKDIKNLIERVYYIDVQQTTYETYANRDYADSRGFRISLNKRKGAITGSIKYNYGVAMGKSSTPFNFSPIFREQPKEGEQAVELPPNTSNADVLLDFDRTHNLIVQVSAKAPDDFGPEILGFYPLEGFTVSVKSSVSSGRPFTYDTEGLGLRYNRRSPAEYRTDLSLNRYIKLFRYNTTFYVEVSNLFNQKIYNYNAVFNNTQNARRYVENPDQLHYYDLDPPFLADQTFIIYGNAPRSIKVGLVINM